MVEKRYEDFLTAHQAQDVAHSGRTFYEHLKGTHDLLRDWGNPEHVCLAGLFHSIYGTNFFRHQCLPFKDRDQLQALIGRKAENLAYLFCVIVRPEAILINIGRPKFVVYDHHAQRQAGLRKDEFLALVEIEVANLLEQGGARKILNRLGAADISPAAKAALGRVI